jgi:uncharacterized membrane protein
MEQSFWWNVGSVIGDIIFFGALFGLPTYFIYRYMKKNKDKLVKGNTDGQEKQNVS